MTKWEYKSFCLRGDSGEDACDLNEQGALGWELVDVVVTDNQLRAYLKRPVAFVMDGRSPEAVLQQEEESEDECDWAAAKGETP